MYYYYLSAAHMATSAVEGGFLHTTLEKVSFT